ncbi:MAG: hypothetical protein WB950_01920, partial [Acidobacteriaceae bacterium]
VTLPLTPLMTFFGDAARSRRERDDWRAAIRRINISILLTGSSQALKYARKGYANQAVCPNKCPLVTTAI